MAHFKEFPEPLTAVTAAAPAAGPVIAAGCALVEPASYLTQWEPNGRLFHWTRPSMKRPTFRPSFCNGVWRRLLGKPGEMWSFRVLNGGAAKALSRLADNTGASLLVVGADRQDPWHGRTGSLKDPYRRPWPALSSAPSSSSPATACPSQWGRDCLNNGVWGPA